MSHPATTVQIMLTDLPNGQVNVRSTFGPHVGQSTSPAESLSLDMCSLARHGGHPVSHDRKATAALSLVEQLLHPEELGYAVTREVRDRARRVLGIPECEGARPHDTARTPLIYVSGPMTEVPDFNHHTFNLAAQALRSAGWRVFNPAENGMSTEAPWAEHMRLDIRRLMDCTHVATLEGWQNSRGAALEVHIANRLGLQVSSLQHWLSRTAREAQAIEVAA